MWKAIVWGFAGLLLGVVLGGAVGAIAGTLIGSVAGALPAVSAWRARRCRTRCRGCPVMCEPKRGSPVRAVAAVAAAAVGVYVLVQVAVVLAVAAGLVLVAVAGLAWGSRRLTDRLSLVHWPSMQPVQRAAVVQAEVQRALPAPPRAIGQARPVEGVVVRDGERMRA